MARAAPRFWLRRCHPLAVALLPLALLFRIVSSVRRALYRRGALVSGRAGVPVVVVGNIAVGGSGKTPVVAWLVEALRAHGHRPGVISRGYGRADTGVRVVTAADDAASVGDEPCMLFRELDVPLAVGADRLATCAALRAAHPGVDVIISDDGLQHYRLRRDCEIVVVDEAVLGNGWLLPAGPLREGRGRLAEAALVIAHGPLGARTQAVLARASVPTAAMTLAGDELEHLTDAGRRQPLRALAGQRVHAVAGIGRPQRFFAQLAAAGLDVVPHPFPDHHRYQPADFAALGDAPVLLTRKDAVKCRDFAPPDSWVLPVRARIDETAFGHVARRLAGRTVENAET